MPKEKSSKSVWKVEGYYWGLAEILQVGKRKVFQAERRSSPLHWGEGKQHWWLYTSLQAHLPEDISIQWWGGIIKKVDNGVINEYGEKQEETNETITKGTLYLF